MDIIELVKIFREELENQADLIKKPQMEAYMKHKFPFVGVQMPVRVKTENLVFGSLKGISSKQLFELVHLLWAQDEREFQSTAVHLLSIHKKILQAKDIQDVANLVVSKSWWDTVDVLATHLVAYLLKSFPEQKQVYLPKWEDSGNIWLIRTTIIFQLKYREHTDFEYLKKQCIRNADSKEFFIQKAMGWALREYAKKNPETVIDFIENQELPKLTVREAAKHLK